MKGITRIAAAAAEVSFSGYPENITEPIPTSLENASDTAAQTAVSAGGYLLPMVLLILILTVMAALLLALFIQQQRILRILNSLKTGRKRKVQTLVSAENTTSEISSAHEEKSGLSSGNADTSEEKSTEDQNSPESNTPRSTEKQEDPENTENQNPSVVPKENRDTEFPPPHESSQQSKAAPKNIPPTPAPLPIPVSQRRKVCGLAMRADVRYNPSTKIAFSENTGSQILLELYSDNTIVPSQICFQSYNTASFYQQNGFPYIFDLISRNGAKVRLSRDTKLLQVQQPAEAVITSGRIYLKQKGILMVEERQG